MNRQSDSDFYDWHKCFVVLCCIALYCNIGAHVQLFGPRHAETIALPPCENFMNVEVQRTVASKLLSDGLQRGIVIHCVDDSIFVYRLCQFVLRSLVIHLRLCRS